jgi:hypothetical protein
MPTLLIVHIPLISSRRTAPHFSDNLTRACAACALAHAASMTLLLQLLPVLLLLLPPMCFCIAPRFEEELSQLLLEEGAPSCAYDSPPLRTWRFPVAGSLGGSGMVWEEWAAEAAAQGAASPHVQQPLHHRHHRPAPRPSFVIYDPVSDSSISATEAQLTQGLAVLQVPFQRSSSAAAVAHSDGSAGGCSAPCRCCRCCCRRRG